jgi:hypothetical protein
MKAGDPDQGPPALFVLIVKRPLMKGAQVSGLDRFRYRATQAGSSGKKRDAGQSIPGSQVSCPGWNPEANQISRA